VPEALASLDDRATPDLALLAPLMGADSRDWHGLAADSRYDSARAALSGPDFPVA
jgi:hypothetical protein